MVAVIAGTVATVLALTLAGGSTEQWQTNMTSNSILGLYEKAAVAADAGICSEIGR